MPELKLGLNDKLLFEADGSQPRAESVSLQLDESMMSHCRAIMIYQVDVNSSSTSVPFSHKISRDLEKGATNINKSDKFRDLY